MTNADDTQLRDAVKLLLEHLVQDNRSSTAIAQDVGVSQPTVSRLRRSLGRRARWSGSFNKLCSFYRIPLPGAVTPGRGYNELLREAIIDAWDGTNEGGQALLTLVKTLKDLIKPTSNSRRSFRGNHPRSSPGESGVDTSQGVDSGGDQSLTLALHPASRGLIPPAPRYNDFISFCPRSSPGESGVDTGNERLHSRWFPRPSLFTRRVGG